MVQIKKIALTSLLLDHGNYRINNVESQREAITAIVQDQANGKKLAKPAEDILQFGLSPMEKIMVYPSPDHKGKYVVHDGNRRVTALKILAKPEILGKGPLARKFKRLAETHTIPNRIECVVVNDREV